MLGKNTCDKNVATYNAGIAKFLPDYKTTSCLGNVSH